MSEGVPMNRFAASLISACALLAAATSVRAGECCADRCDICGCQCQCQKTCRLIVGHQEGPQDHLLLRMRRHLHSRSQQALWRNLRMRNAPLLRPLHQDQDRKLDSQSLRPDTHQEEAGEDRNHERSAFVQMGSRAMSAAIVPSACRTRARSRPVLTPPRLPPMPRLRKTPAPTRRCCKPRPPAYCRN